MKTIKTLLTKIFVITFKTKMRYTGLERRKRRSIGFNMNRLNRVYYV